MTLTYIVVIVSVLAIFSEIFIFLRKGRIKEASVK